MATSLDLSDADQKKFAAQSAAAQARSALAVRRAEVAAAEGKLFEVSVGRASALPWPAQHFDVLVGNPPWDEPPGRAASSFAERWAAARDLPVGDRSPSHAASAACATPLTLDVGSGNC